MPDVDVSSDGTCKRDDTACIKQASDVGRSTVWNGYMHGVGACKYEILAENGPSVARQFGIGITQAAHGIIEYADVQAAGRACYLLAQIVRPAWTESRATLPR
jgi:hypothetical protein